MSANTDSIISGLSLLVTPLKKGALVVNLFLFKVSLTEYLNFMDENHVVI